MTSPAAATPTAVSSIVGVVGYGVTGSRVGAQLARQRLRIAVFDPTVYVKRVGVVNVHQSADLAATDVIALCQPGGHAELAADYLAEGVCVVSTSADVADVRAMLELDDLARRHEATLIIGAGMSPGLSGLLANYLAGQLHVAEEFHVATHGTAGPACATQHHHALGETALGWHDGAWIERPGGSGRELDWFPEPIGARDCYRASLVDPIIMHRLFSDALRISARVSGTRRDRLTARLPMLVPPHADGDLGAVRVEVRGASATGARNTLIAGASGPTGDLAAAVATAAVEACLSDTLQPGAYVVGEAALDPAGMLRRVVELGVVLQEFTGVARATTW
jgi:hypothetical protein